ncbi:antithrombin-iii-like protein [Lasius niger]|uniref:Antithrombin-iii-like protein n=1 Tax=Lasius niger TaxID=67767 RepID=A0A0J7KAL4_LASNI|nr:antithrombin-iii-like protein [Lasius niger]
MHVSEFPYKNESTSLFVLLPASKKKSYWRINMDKNVTNIYVLIMRLSTEEGICELRNLLNGDTTSEDVTDVTDTYFSTLLTRPNFELERNLPIRKLLRALGAEELLMPDAINLDSFFVENKESVHLGNAVHRTHVKVTEEDTIAGSATVIYTGQERCSSTKQVVVNNNYPFIWLIYDKLRKDILFVGAFNKFAYSLD